LREYFLPDRAECIRIQLFVFNAQSAVISFFMMRSAATGCSAARSPMAARI
jgi:hypothetical protein